MTNGCSDDLRRFAIGGSTPVQSGIRNTIPLWPVAVLTAAAVGLIAVVLGASGYGFDITDEGYYLNSIFYADMFRPSLTRFGDVWYAALPLVGERVWALRAANTAIGGLLCAIVAWMAFPLAERPGLRLLVAAGSCAAWLSYMRLGLLTPNYNTLTYQGILLVACGLLASRRNTGLAAALLVGLGGWLTFMAKPSSAALLAAVTILTIMLQGGRGWHRLIATSGAVAALALLLGAYLIDGGVKALFANLYEGLDQAVILRGETVGVEGIPPLATDVVTRILPLAAAVFFAELMLIRGSVALGRFIAIAVLLLPVAAVLWCFADGRAQDILQRLLPAAGIGTGCAALVARWGLVVRQRAFALAFFMMAGPIVFAYGSSNSLHTHHLTAGGLYWLAALPLAATARHVPVVGYAVALSGAAAMTAQSLVTPYRQSTPIFSQSAILSFARGGDLRVEQDVSDLAAALRDQAEVLSAPNTPLAVVDMTGRSPGLVFALGAVPVGAAWMIGGYDGSNELARQRLADLEENRIATALALVWPENRRAIAPGVLPFGLRPAEETVSTGKPVLRAIVITAP